MSEAAILSRALHYNIHAAIHITITWVAGNINSKLDFGKRTPLIRRLVIKPREHILSGIQ